MNISELKQRLGAFQWYLVIIFIIGVSLYGGFHLGNVYYQQQLRLVSTHEHSIQNLKDENNKLTKNLNILGVELEVARLTQQKSFVEIEQGIEREKDLRKQVAFYQQVMAPELNEEGMLIDGFHVETALSDNSYRFELVLMQQNKIKKPLKGKLKVTLNGSENGRAQQYSLNGLLVDQQQKDLKFNFKYFQVIQGEFVLPEDFMPELITVHTNIYQFNRKKGELTTDFPWQVSAN